MYNFRDTTSDWRFHEEWLPTVAMNFDGGFIEHIVSGYRTLTVSGREMLGVELTTEDVANGCIVTEERLPARELVITYQLDANSSEELLTRFKQLESLLMTGKDVPIFFNDERDWVYYGRLSAVDSVPVESNSVVSTFTILCSDPKRYGRELTTSDGLIRHEGKLIPLSIEFDIPSNTSYFVSNGVQTIKGTNASAEVSTHVKIDFMTCDTYSNGKLDYKIIALDSDFENFTLENGMTITSNVNNLIIRYSEVS
ncbi:distal tail protein Dit [Enterococcus sp. GC40]|uniref:distal tail protein Dit n=1 Tax=Enterococcus sp. GC40 TaxID=3231359 RepID=UPI00349FFCDD